MAGLHLSSQQEHAALGFGMAALLLAVGGAYLLLRGNGAVVSPAAGLVFVLLSLPFAAATAAIGFRPFMSGNLPWLLRPLITVNLLLLAAVIAFVAYHLALFVISVVQTLYDLLHYGFPM
jgi:hypothetical protein